MEAQPLPAPFSPVGRIPIVNVMPVIEQGRWSAKGTVNESFPVHATVFREGHDAWAAEAVLLAPDGREHQRVLMEQTNSGLNRFEGWLTPNAPGQWSFRVDAWSDPYGTWAHDATVKIDAGVDEDLMMNEGIIVLKRAMKNMPTRTPQRDTVRLAIDVMSHKRLPVRQRLAAGTGADVKAAIARYPLRDYLSSSPTFPLAVDRERALEGAWYEIFPRSTGAWQDETGEWHSGTLRTAMKDLDRIAGMGFNVVYLTPIHPIGTTNRKGRNNTLTAELGDPGSPYGIGSEDGGHDAIHPELGTFEDFDAFVARSRELGLEVALDIALQCSPDHPWVTEHPEWFTTRADGSIAFAENPPKKYQDIYPLNFDNDPEGIYVAIRDMLEVWVAHGVTLFRVDNPHTKPLTFWQRILAEFRVKHPDVIFLAEAFTRPPMMQTLGAVGFHQSYTYFAWRNDKTEIEEYLTELSVSAHRLRPAFWPTTHDILTPYMQRGGVPAFAIRAVLAATSGPTWGIYSGYELAENIARPGAEEQIDNEKYEFKSRDWSRGSAVGMSNLLRQLNEIRDNHTALRRLRDLTIHRTTSDKILAFSKVARPEETGGEADVMLVIINLDPYATHDAIIDLDVAALGGTPRYDGEPVLEVHDELSDQTFQWNATPFVRLDPHGQCAHVLSVRAL